MGFACDSGYTMLLQARNDDLTASINTKSENLLQLQDLASQLVSSTANILPNSPQFQQLMVKQAQLSQIGKSVEMDLDQTKAQQKAVSTELDAVKKQLTDDVKIFNLSSNS